MYIYLLTLLIYLNMLIFYFQIDFDLYIIQIVEKINILKDILYQFIIKIGYNLLYSFSVCQILLNKIKKFIKPYKQIVVKYLKKNNIINDVKIPILSVIDKNGNINTKIITDTSINLELLENIFEIEEVSGLIINDKNDETDCINRIYVEKWPVLKEGNIDYDVSNIIFMMVELEHKNEKYIIELKNEQYNYYIVNNSLNKNFFKYYLKNILKATIDYNNFDYIVSIIDHNVNIININQDQYIIIEKNNYQIYKEQIQNNDNKKLNNLNITYNSMVNEQDSNDSDKSDDFVKLDPL